MISLKQFNTAHLAFPLLVLAAEAALVANLVGVEFDPSELIGFAHAHTGAAATPDFVVVPPHKFTYRPSGIFFVDGRESDGHLQQGDLTNPLTIMRNQVSEANYGACVAAGACAPADIGWPSADLDRPVTGVSHEDAIDYAAWLSAETGQTWRLPTDVEWIAAAGSRARDDAVGIEGDASNGAARWLQAYALQSEARTVSGPPQPTGYFGVNEFGLSDLSGNVWEWTDTCFSRTRQSVDGEVLSVLETCGVRVVEGLHRTYVSTFIRDAKAGGCAVGAPPTHLGFRLVQEPPRGLGKRLGNWLAVVIDIVLPGV